MDPTSPHFWTALGEIVVANIVLSGDNAVVIAMAARALPAPQQRKAIAWGGAAAIVLRIGLTVAAAAMLRWPYLKVVGALLLVWIGISLLGGEDEAAGERQVGVTLLAAIRTILVADVVMSLDNVLALAAAAAGDTLLLVIGLAVSVPLIVFGSTLLVTAMERYPVIVTLGAAMLGWLAGEMLVGDPAVVARFGAVSRTVEWVASLAGAALVVAIGRGLRARRRAAASKT